MTLDETWGKVAEFHQRFGHPVGNSPSRIQPDRARKRYDWMLEEINEFLSATDIADHEEATTEQVDAMIDLIYFALGTLVEMGIKPEEFFEIVHKANMSKVWPDGTVHYNASGKTIKPPTWEDPHEQIRSAIKRNAHDRQA
jgi:predicted HAD superfamily Cof-like phosphohydrolase